MVDGIIEISEDGQYVSKYHGFLIVSSKGTEQGRIPLSEVAAVIFSANQVQISKKILIALAEHNAAVICCGANYLPVSMSLPYAGNFEAGHRMRCQIAAKATLSKKLWQRIIQEKVRNQAMVLDWVGKENIGKKLRAMAKKVRSGDPDNMEAQAAREYWPHVIRPQFRRERTADDENILFNYCYTILRSAVARAVVSVGLLPALGMYHRARLNPYSLVDDLMEPYRPLADSLVIEAVHTMDKPTELKPEVKRALARLLRLDLKTETGISPLMETLHNLAYSLMKSYTHQTEQLRFANMLL